MTAVNPMAGPVAGGTTVTITGTSFTSANAVTFGGTPAAAFTVVSPTTITATTPAHASGVVDVSVTTPLGGTSQINQPGDEFIYGPPSVTSVNPTAGPIAGGTTVTVTGTNFTQNSTVSFGGTASRMWSSTGQGRPSRCAHRPTPLGRST